LNEEQRKSQPELKIIEPDKPPEGKQPLLLGLHGNNSNALEFSDYWGGLTDKGWLVALPQSAEIAARGLYVWTDIKRVERDVSVHYETLQQQYAVDENKTVIAGFSKGGHAAIHIALKEFFPVRGFLALAPFVGDMSPWLPLINSCINKKMRGYFVLGGKDQHCTPGALLLKNKLIESGIKCEVEIFPEMSHDIPINFDEVLQKAIKFIFNE
jgi:predicted esterase